MRWHQLQMPARSWDLPPTRRQELLGGSRSACSTTPLPCLWPWGGAQDRACPPGEDQRCALQPRAGERWGSHPPLCPSILQRDEPQLLLVWVGVGCRAGGNSSGRDPGMLQLFPNSHHSCPAPCMQGRVSGIPGVPLSWQPLCHTSGLGQHLPSCVAPVGCGLLAGPPAVPKRSRARAARHLPGVFAAPSEPTLKVLCSVCWFPSSPRHEKGLFAMPRLWCIGSVLLMRPVLWHWAFPLPQAKALVCLASHPAAPSSSFPPETILCLQHGFSCCGDHIPGSWFVPGGAARRSALRPEWRGTPQPSPGGVMGGSGCQL